MFRSIINPCMTILLVVVFVERAMSNTDVVVERMFIDLVDASYGNYTAVVRRHSRRSPYLIHIKTNILKTVGPDLATDILFFEFLHNEYRRTFVEIHIKICDLFHKEPYKSALGAALLESGMPCPIPPGNYHIENVTASLKNFPYVWPFEKLMVQFKVTEDSTHEIILSGRIYGSFKRKLPQ